MNPKQARFCEEFLLDLNGKQAAIRAGYSTRSAESTASRLLSNDKVSAKITELKASRSERLSLDADGIVQRLIKIADMDLRKLFDESGNLIPVTELDADTAYALSSIEVIDQTTDDGPVTWLKKFRASDKLRALELLGKHLGMFVDKVETTDTTPKVTFIIPDNGRDKPNPTP